MKLSTFREKATGDEAVSPVIGVILMVAVTVILAAVVAAFVFGVIGQPKASPQTQLELTDHGDALTDSADNLVEIKHRGGDPVNVSETKIMVGSLTLNGDDAGVTGAGNDVLEVGESLEVQEPSDVFNASTDADVKVVHNPTDSVLATEEVKLE